MAFLLAHVRSETYCSQDEWLYYDFTKNYAWIYLQRAKTKTGFLQLSSITAARRKTRKRERALLRIRQLDTNLSLEHPNYLLCRDNGELWQFYETGNRKENKPLTINVIVFVTSKPIIA